MTEADVIQPSASIASTGKGLRYVGGYVYAYSGAIELAATTTEYTMLEFNHKGGIIVGKLRIGSHEQTNDAIVGKLYFNNQIIDGIYTDGTQDYPSVSAIEPIFFIIPPATEVKVTIERLSGSTTPDMFAVLTGRVHGAE